MSVPQALESFYCWTPGWQTVLSLIGLVCLVVALVWTAGILVIYALIG